MGPEKTWGIEVKTKRRPDHVATHRKYYLLSPQPESGRCGLQVILLESEKRGKSENSPLRGPPGSHEPANLGESARVTFVLRAECFPQSPHFLPKTPLILLVIGYWATRRRPARCCALQLVEESRGEKGFSVVPVQDEDDWII